MEQNYREILSIILPDSSDNEFDEFDTIAPEYLSKLSKMTFEQILGEPARLAEERKILTEQMQELALANYRTFVETADCSNQITKDFNVSKRLIDNVIEKIPELMTECENFAATSKEVIKDKAFNEQIQNQSERILNILELPIMMPTALSQGDYESALDVFTYIRNLSKKYPDVVAIQNINAEVTRLWFETLHRLFNQLRHDLPLPQCLQLLGYLRKANAVYQSTLYENSQNNENSLYVQNVKASNSDGLQLHFLKARGSWFDAELEEVLSEEGGVQLRKVIDLHRIHLFNILTQYKAIFLSEAQTPKSKIDELNGFAAVSCWLKEKVINLMKILKNHVVSEDESSLESIMNQCMYLCLSFGRVGADMRAVIAPLFADLTMTNFVKALRKANEKYDNEMKHFKLVNRIGQKNITDNENNPNSPPDSLLAFYPLAEYCNNCVTALNNLRIVAPFSLATQVIDTLSDSLVSVAKVLSVYYHREQQGFSPSERETFISYLTVFTDDLVPFIQTCINQIFSPNLLAEYLGISVLDVQEEKLLHLHIETVTNPINEVLDSIKS